jgi:peptide/nickel transport system permease protein
MTTPRLGVILAALFALLAIGAPWLSPVGPSETTDVVMTRFLPPGAVDHTGLVHLLGTDRLGRDVWSRFLFGARVSLTVGLLATLTSLVIGVLVGGMAALFPGALSHLLLGVTDFALAVPRVVLLLLLAALWEPSAALVIVTLGLTGWMPIARLVYLEALSQLGRPYLDAAQALGGSRPHLFLRHILPNAAPSFLAAVTLGVGNAISLEAGLSFLGVGVQPPTPSWGGLIGSGRETVVNAPWVGLAPGIALVLVVIACTLIADGFERRVHSDRHQLAGLGLER